MSLFEQASLVITPNAQKEGKLYSIKPTDGSGDLDVVRATSATRVNEQGLVEIPRTNLLLRSEEFDDAYWTKQNTTTTSNQSIAPDGTNTADLLYPNSTGTFRAVRRNVTVSGIQTYTFSFFAKASGFQWLRIRSIEGNPIYANFDVLNGIVGVVETGLTASITPFNNGWFRCVVVGNSSSTIASCYINLSDDNGTGAPNATANGTNGVFLWGAQLEVGNVATDYIPTTSVIRTRFAGITQDGGSANNIPRLDYTNASCPSILVEPQRTNVVRWSGDLSQSNWIKTNYTLSNTTPIQGLTATRVTKNSTNNGFYAFTGSRNIINFVGTFSEGTKAFSCLIRKGNTARVALSLNQVLVGGLSIVSCEFDFATETFTNVAIGLTTTFEKPTTDVYRLILVINDTGTNTNKNFWITPVDSLRNTVTDGYVDIAYAQWELGANATSYIPTQASTVTRNADVISKTGISSLIGQTEGTVFIDFDWLGNLTLPSRLFQINNGTSSSDIFFNINATTGNIQLFVNNVGKTSGAFFNINTIKKLALVYTTTSLKVYINGTLDINISESVSFSLLDRLNVGSSNLVSDRVANIRVKNFMILKTALTDQQAIQLTTL